MRGDAKEHRGLHNAFGAQERIVSTLLERSLSTPSPSDTKYLWGGHHWVMTTWNKVR